MKVRLAEEQSCEMSRYVTENEKLKHDLTIAEKNLNAIRSLVLNARSELKNV